MFCTVCGNEINAGQCFCGVCGQKCPPSRVHFSTMINETRSELPTFKDFTDSKNAEAQNITKAKTTERKGRFMGTKKKKEAVEMVKVSACT